MGILEGSLKSSSKIQILAGRPRFGSARLRFGDGTVRAVPVCGSGGSSAKRVFFSVYQYSLTGKRTVPVSVSVPGKRFQQFRFCFRFREKRFRQFRFPVPVRFLSHLVLVKANHSLKRFLG